MRASHLILAWLLLAAPIGAPAAEPSASCPAVDDSHLPPALSAWTQRTDLAAATGVSELSSAVLPLGKGVDGKLAKNSDVTFPVLPGKPGGSVSYGGLYAVDVAEAGDYQVSLGAGAWIELANDQGLVESASHAPGPACSSLRKTVIFPLKPGRYILEVTGNGDPGLALMVSRLVP